MKTKSPAKQFDECIAKYTPEIAKFAKAVLRQMRARLPGAVELVYDNYNFLVIGFGPNERPSDAVFSIILAPQWVTLCFLWGKGLPDPERLLRGSGNQVRNIRLQSPADLDKPAVQALIDAAIERARVPFVPGARRRLIIKSISAQQRPRRPKCDSV